MLCLIALAPARLCWAQPGSVVAWGNSFGQSRVVPGEEYMAVCAGGYHSLAIAADGTLVAWGEDTYGQCNVPRGRDFVVVAAGQYHSLALKSDGSVVAWGDNSRGQCSVPSGHRELAQPGHSVGWLAGGLGLERSQAVRRPARQELCRDFRRSLSQSGSQDGSVDCRLGRQRGRPVRRPPPP